MTEVCLTSHTYEKMRFRQNLQFSLFQDLANFPDYLRHSHLSTWWIKIWTTRICSYAYIGLPAHCGYLKTLVFNMI